MPGSNQTGMTGSIGRNAQLEEVPVRLPLPRPSGGHYGSIYEVQASMPKRYFA